MVPFQRHPNILSLPLCFVHWIIIKLNPSRFGSKNRKIPAHMSLQSTSPKLERYTLARVPLSALLTDYDVSGSDPFTCRQNRLVRCVPPFTFTPRRFPAESDDPALNPPARFVAVR